MTAIPLRTDYGFLRKIVLARSRNVLDPSRDYLFEARLARLVRNAGMNGLHELIQHLRSARDEDLEQAIAEAMTINETSFFRDGRPFELLHTELLPELILARRNQRTLRLWSAACASGQEAYSLAMLIRQHFPSLSSWRVRIDGTDICSDLVKRAQAGRYERIEVNRGLPARFLVRFFDREGEQWVVKPELRAMCQFRAANLCSSPLSSAEKRDVIFLRNVMLYFGPECRRNLMAEMHRVLTPDGVLFLGASEQPVDGSLWTTVMAGGTCYFRPTQRS